MQATLNPRTKATLNSVNSVNRMSTLEDRSEQTDYVYIYLGERRSAGATYTSVKFSSSCVCLLLP